LKVLKVPWLGAERDDGCFYDALLSVTDVGSVQGRGRVRFWMALVFQLSESFLCVVGTRGTIVTFLNTPDNSVS